MNDDKIAIVGLVCLFMLLLVCVPIATIVSLNVLFHVGIPLTFKTWGAAGFLVGVFYTVPSSRRKS